MDISKIELMKEDLFNALDDGSIDSPEFQQRHYKWLIEDENADLEEAYVDAIFSSILQSSKNTIDSMSRGQLNKENMHINQVIGKVISSVEHRYGQYKTDRK